MAIEKAYLVKQLSALQKQAVIKLIEKKGRNERYIQNWRPISLLNVDIKLISKALAERLKNVLHEIISPNQNAYVKNRCIREGGRLISDLLEMSEVLNKQGFLVTIDIEKAFDSVNHHFLIAIRHLKGVLKGVKVALCGMRCVNLYEDTITILGIHYSYNKQIENDENFKKYIAKIENALKLWRARNLSLEGKITVFKSLALSKITHLALVKKLPPSIIDQLNKTQKNFIWNGLNPKIKNSTINNNYENGGLKNVNIAAKISSLQSSWIKKFFDENFNDWKIISLHIIHKSLGKKFVFHSNLKVIKK